MLKTQGAAKPAEVLSMNILSSRGRTIRPKTVNQKKSGRPAESDTVSTAAEDGLSSEKETVDKQSSRARIPEEGDDLLQ
mgnify:CR=1 FL=1